MDYIRHRQLTIPVVDLQAPKVDAHQLADGKANWTFPFMTAKADASAPASTNPDPKLGTLRIADGAVHVRAETLKADFNVDVKTEDSADGTGQIAANAKGTYAAQPITAQFVGGALLSLRTPVSPTRSTSRCERAHPGDPGRHRPGPAGVRRREPEAGAGRTRHGVAAAADRHRHPRDAAVSHRRGNWIMPPAWWKFHQFNGKVGSSDLAGDIDVDTKSQRPVVTAGLQSKLVDLKDLGGFIGASPGETEKGTKTAPSNGKVLPTDPINLPKLNAADVHLKYHAVRIQGRRQPLENMQANLDIVNGRSR